MPDNYEKDGPHNLPLARVKAIVSLVHETVPISPEALFLMSKAAELFIENLAKEVYEKNKKCFENRMEMNHNMDYDELAEYINSNEDLDYLWDYFPKRMTFQEALTKYHAHNNH